MSTCRRRGRSRAEARREESARLVEQIAGAVGRLVLGGDLPPEVGLGAIDLYATVTGDSILSAFARGALQHRLEKKAATDQTSTKKTEAVVGSTDYAASIGQARSLDEFRARRARETDATTSAKEQKR